MTVDDCKFILTSNSIWKCDPCNGLKVTRGDNTPIKLSSDKLKPKSNNDSDSDSNKSSSMKIACLKCLKGFSYNAHRAVCHKCDANYHFKCADITKDNYSKLQSQWACLACKDKDVGSSSASSLSVLSDKIAASVGDYVMGQSHEISVPVIDPTGEISLKQLFTEILNLRSEIRQSNLEITNSLNTYGEWIVENGKKMEELSKAVLKTAADIEDLQQENINLRKSNADLTVKVDTLEQATRENVVEIYGVPFNAKENLIDILSKISQVIGFDFNRDMIDNCYRFGAVSGRSGAIVAKFVRKLDMEAFLEKRRQKRNPGPGLHGRRVHTGVRERESYKGEETVAECGASSEGR
ncbi:hypothetical protein J6590_024696 [Homalodisca vitripennis]|nr:hypothetical protein J6590_024696 [Homalodisca vitripennis]